MKVRYKFKLVSLTDYGDGNFVPIFESADAESSGDTCDMTPNGKLEFMTNDVFLIKKLKVSQAYYIDISSAE